MSLSCKFPLFRRSTGLAASLYKGTGLLEQKLRRQSRDAQRDRDQLVAAAAFASVAKERHPGHLAMSADPILYCLELVSDYRDFERLCSALLSGTGYPGIDPLGGTGDEGRDAIVRIDEAGRRISFAYTVRSDWRVKLGADCKRVHEKGHSPDVFARGRPTSSNGVHCVQHAFKKCRTGNCSQIVPTSLQKD